MFQKKGTREKSHHSRKGKKKPKAPRRKVGMRGEKEHLVKRRSAVTIFVNMSVFAILGRKNKSVLEEVTGEKTKTKNLVARRNRDEDTTATELENGINSISIRNVARQI